MTRPPLPIRHHHPETPDRRALAAARAYLLTVPAPTGVAAAPAPSRG